MTNAQREQRLRISLGWMDRGTEFFEAELAQLRDDQLSEPSRLPGWTRLHVVSHMARNARALTNLLGWAESGVESPMYPTPEHRSADIDAGAKLPAGEVRADALAEAGRFRQAISALPADAWGAEVRTALGRATPASEIPWMRVREVWVHGVDLSAQATFADIDDEVAAALLAEAAERLAGQDDCPSIVLIATGPAESTHVIGSAGPDPLVARGTSQALAGWLLGRTAGAGVECSVPLPDLPRWL
jgi:maleylpyruvate isomerase